MNGAENVEPPKIMDLVKDRTVKFIHYRDGNFIYEINSYEANSFTFPVPLSDVGTATLLAEDKAIFFMRWIRLQLATMDTSWNK